MASEVQLFLRGEDADAHTFSALDLSGSALDEAWFQRD